MGDEYEATWLTRPSSTMDRNWSKLTWVTCSDSMLGNSRALSSITTIRAMI